MTSAPILLLGFNRLETLQQVLPRVRDARPERVYITCDGPRDPQERVKTDAVRAYMLETVDWTPHVKTLFQDVNLGCGQAVASAITWFFAQEEMGIILEDDCLPHPDFFAFCTRNLERFRDDSRVSMIAGMNYLERLPADYPYEGFFSQYYPIWGWASWRRAWAQFDPSMPGWASLRKRNALKQMLHDRIKWKTFTRIFDLMQSGRVDTWDLPWVYTQLMNSSLALVPAVNLISNIGYVGTHSSDTSPFLGWPVHALDRPAVIKKEILAEHDFDSKIFKKICRYM